MKLQDTLRKRCIDDVYTISDKEKSNIIKSYFCENGALRNYPVKEKKKVVVFQEVAKNFSKGKVYSEKEVNLILKGIYEDYVSLRRDLIEYNFMDRTDDCSSYWVKE